MLWDLLLCEQQPRGRLALRPPGKLPAPLRRQPAGRRLPLSGVGASGRAAPPVTRPKARRYGDGTHCRLTEAIPAATLRPVVPSLQPVSIEGTTGLNVAAGIALLLPPTSTFAPTPTPAVACAVAPPKLPASAHGAGVAVGANTVHTRTPPWI